LISIAGFLVFAMSDAQSEGIDHHDLRVEPGNAGPDLMRVPPGRRRGRPPKMSAQEILDRIRRLAVSRGGLFRVHQRNASLYARARRIFGSWSAAVRTAGLDYGEALIGARRRSARKRRHRSRRAGTP
jgi:hypothetical protein